MPPPFLGEAFLYIFRPGLYGIYVAHMIVLIMML